METGEKPIYFRLSSFPLGRRFFLPVCSRLSTEFPFYVLLSVSFPTAHCFLSDISVPLEQLSVIRLRQRTEVGLVCKPEGLTSVHDDHTFGVHQVFQLMLKVSCDIALGFQFPYATVRLKKADLTIITDTQ